MIHSLVMLKQDELLYCGKSETRFWSHQQRLGQYWADQIIARKLKFLSKINFFLVSGEPICPGVLCWPLGMIAWLHMIEYMIAYDVFYCMLTCVALDFHAHLKGTCFTKKNSNRTETHKIEALQHSKSQFNIINIMPLLMAFLTSLFIQGKTSVKKNCYNPVKHEDK